MFDTNKSIEMLEGFEAHYNYDTNYMKEMLRVAPKAYETFEAFLPMANFSNKIPTNVLYVAKVTAMRHEDCAACLQLNVDMALEAGINKEILQEILMELALAIASTKIFPAIKRALNQAQSCSLVKIKI